MKILTPLNDIDSMYRLHEAGADEFYVGFSDSEWEEYFGPFSDLNRLSSYGGDANQSLNEKIASCMENAHYLGIPLYVTFNAAHYDDEKLRWIDYYMETIAQYGAAGVIISTPELAELADRHGIPAVASTMCGVYNSDIARFYADLNVKRIILPRELSLDSIQKIISDVPQMEYEVFLMRNGCRYSDSYCLGMHGGLFGGLCYDQSMRRPNIILQEGISDEIWNQVEYNNYLFENVFHKTACGQCALWRFLKMGVSAVKIVGRMEDADAIAVDVQMTRYNLAVAEDSKTEAEYLRNMAMPDDRFEYCAGGLSCYYPEVRFK